MPAGLSADVPAADAGGAGFDDAAAVPADTALEGASGEGSRAMAGAAGSVVSETNKLRLAKRTATAVERVAVKLA